MNKKITHFTNTQTDFHTHRSVKEEVGGVRNNDTFTVTSLDNEDGSHIHSENRRHT